MSMNEPIYRTPWRLHDQYGCDIYARDWYVGTTSASGHPSADDHDLFGQDRINASHIVKCVNAHDELVAALRTIATFPVTGTKNQDAYNMVLLAQAALSEAGVP